MNESKLRSIVVGTDFNELAASALRFAGGIAAASGAELTVVYADTFEPPAEFTSSQVRRIADSIERSRARAREQLERHVRDRVDHDVRTKLVVSEGAPASSIVKTAASVNADLIVLGTHGRGGLERMMLGSVAESVMREAPVPVLTVRSTATPGSIRRILCPVNGSDIAAIAVDRAAQIARAVDAELALLHVASPADRSPFDINALKPEGVRTSIVKCEIAHDDAAAEILAAEERGAYDLIVIGAEHKFVRDVTIFGNTTASVTRHARTPVLTVTRQAARPQTAAPAGVDSHVV